MLPLILAGGMIAKQQLIDKPKEERQRKLQAITAQYSPWTGMTPQAVQESSPFEAGLQGASMGLAQQQNMDMQEAQMGNLKAQANYYDRSSAAQPSTDMSGMASNTYGPKRSMFEGLDLNFGKPKSYSTRG